MWFHRSGIVWIYFLLFTLHTIFSNTSHISHLLLFPLHLYLLHKLTAPFIKDAKSLNSLRSRFLLTVILSPVVLLSYSVCFALQSAVALLIFFFSTYEKWVPLIQALNGNNTEDLQSAFNTTVLQMTDVTSDSNFKPTETLSEIPPPGLAHKAIPLVLRGIFDALWSTALAWLLPKGHLSMVTTVGDGYVQIGEVQLNKVMSFALAGALGLRVGLHMIGLCLTFALRKVLSRPWWLNAIVQPVQRVMTLSRALISAGTFAKKTALKQKVWPEIWLLLLLNFLGCIVEEQMEIEKKWEKWPLLIAFLVLLEGATIFYTGWKCFRQLWDRNRGSASLG